MKFIALARAKINLAIDVLSRQENGYHQVAMVLQSISLADRLFFEPRENGILLTCTDPGLTCGEDNLVIKAALALQARQPPRRLQGVEIRLEKNIPLEAGLGGGSCDAAATLMALNRLWDVGLSPEELKQVGFSLGADVPFCLTGGTALAQGLGEKIMPLPPFPPLSLVVVKPPFGLSTAQVYGSLSLRDVKRRPDLKSLMEALRKGEAEGVFPHMINVLEEGVGAKKGEIDALKAGLQAAGARGVLMSGSGSSVFGFFNSTGDAAEAASIFRSRGLWSQGAAVCSRGVELQGL